MAKIKFKGKGFTKNLMHDGKTVLLPTVGIIGAQKFLDFKTLMPNADPNGFMMKQEGLIKFAVPLIATSAMPKMPEWVKLLLYGVAIQGAIKATRQYTTNKDTGKAFVDQIGMADIENELKGIAEAVKKSVTTQYQTSVSGYGDALEGAGGFGLPETVSLMNNSQTSVSGIGLDASDFM